MNIRKAFYYLSVLGLFFFSSCQEDGNDDVTLMGSARIEITDAPIDDAKVNAVFVTVADVQVDGQSVQGFNKTTIDLLAYQNGNTELLATSDLEAKAYSEITLVLDYEEDDNGNSPGCYVREEGNNTKHPLASSSNQINLDYDLNIQENTQSQILIDFDLRKSIVRDNQQDDEYEFVSGAELEAALRVVAKNNTGVVQGNCSDLVSGGDKIVVYAYKKGSYNREAEVSGQGQSNIEFANAVSSSSVDANGDFELHFLEEGDYEIVYCAYEENTEGEMELSGTLTVDVLGNLNIGNLSVNASSSVTINVLVTGLLPI